MAGAGSGLASSFSLAALFLVFLKIGAILFGGGYVLVALIRSNLVAHLHWISERQLLDAIAMGQVTPGPISTTATFIGFLLAGVPGAAIATIAIFLPAFFFVAISGPLVPRLRQSPLAGAVSGWRECRRLGSHRCRDLATVPRRRGGLDNSDSCWTELLSIAPLSNQFRMAGAGRSGRWSWSNVAASVTASKPHSDAPYQKKIMGEAVCFSHQCFDINR